jgi:hypothetical protein
MCLSESHNIDKHFRSGMILKSKSLKTKVELTIVAHMNHKKINHTNINRTHGMALKSNMTIMIM